jgi:hypothetical protein
VHTKRQGCSRIGIPSGQLVFRVGSLQGVHIINNTFLGSTAGDCKTTEKKKNNSIHFNILLLGSDGFSIYIFKTPVVETTGVD